MTAPAIARHWAALIVIAIGLASLQMLHANYRNWQQTLSSVVTAVDYVSQSQVRLMRAYLDIERARAGDAMFGELDARVQGRAASDAIGEWLTGYESMLGLRAEEPADARVVSHALTYLDALGAFEQALNTGPVDLVDVRTRFSTAASAGNALEIAVHQQLRERMAAENRRYLILLAAWSGLLALSAAGAFWVTRARHRADESRRLAERRLLRLRLVAPLGILECDASGRILAANDWWCDLTGRGETDWISHPWWEAAPPAARSHAERCWLGAMDRGHTGAGDFQLAGTPPSARAERSAFAPDATPVYVRWAPAPGSDAEAHWVVTFTDITERRVVEEQLRESQKMELMGQLAGAIAHDFNNLLTVIISNAQMLRDSVVPNSEQAAVLDDLEHAALSGSGLVRDLMRPYRRSTVEMQSAELGSVVLESTRLIKRLLPASIELSMDISADTPRVQLDPGLIQQILLNLAANARDAMPGGGGLTIRTERLEIDGDGGPAPAGLYAALAITDTGVGIRSEDLQRIFEPFFTTKKAGQGTGLGLATVQKLVARQGGFLTVDSRPGEGTTFRVLLPREEA